MLETRIEGDPAGEPVLLLHGFPQSAGSWDRLAPGLVEAGYRVHRPDQRGYSAAHRPAGRRSYTLDKLVGDVVELIDAPVHLVGHDWGGVVAWAVAARRPELLRSLTVLSTPHPRSMGKALVTSSQGLKSWYMLAFQLPALPERLILRDDAKGLRDMLRDSGMPAQDAERYVHRMREPGALTAALNWYRAIPFGISRGTGPVAVRTLFVWGEKDFALGRAAAEGTKDHVTGPYEFLPLAGAGHWLPERNTADLLPPILRHLARG